MNRPAQPVQAPRFISASTEGSLERLLADHPRCVGICPRSVSANPAFPNSLAEVAAAISACGEQVTVGGMSSIKYNQIRMNCLFIFIAAPASGVSPSATFVSVRMSEPPERSNRGARRRERRYFVVRKSASPRRFDLLTHHEGRGIGRRLTTGVDPCSRKAHALQDNCVHKSYVNYGNLRCHFQDRASASIHVCPAVRGHLRGSVVPVLAGQRGFQGITGLYWAASSSS